MAPSVNLLGVLNKIRSADIEVHQDRCVMVRNRNSGCSRCADACIGGCISLSEGEIAIAPEVCIGCGSCAAACPSGALEAKSPSDRALGSKCLAAADISNGTASIACRSMLDRAEGLYDPDKVVEVRCLGRVDAELLVSLAAAGVRKVSLSHADCDDCRCSGASGSARAARAKRDADAVLAACGSRTGISVVAGKLPLSARISDGAGYDPGRRSLLARASDGARSAAWATAQQLVEERVGETEPERASFAKVDGRGVLPQALPERRRALLDAIDAMGLSEDVDLDTGLWRGVEIDLEKCRACRMCATFCPTGSLFRFHTKGGKIGVKQRVRQCVGCGTCESVCPADALRLSSSIPAVAVSTGAVRRFEMGPSREAPGASGFMSGSVARLIGCDCVYER